MNKYKTPLILVILFTAFAIFLARPSTPAKNLKGTKIVATKVVLDERESVRSTNSSNYSSSSSSRNSSSSYSSGGSSYGK